MILQAFNIRKEYKQFDSTLAVLKGVDVAIERGEAIAVVGPSGAGKSTLLHILGGLDKPTDGKVIFHGEDLYKLNDANRARIRNRQIGFIFQFYHLLPEFTALENVLLPSIIKEGMKQKNTISDRAESLLSLIGLKERVKHKPHQLSGGEQQRVAIARALMNEPDIIFCDEPTGNLDSKTGGEIIDLLMGLNKEKQQTFLFVTHDEKIAQRCHRVIHLRDGRVVETSVKV